MGWQDTTSSAWNSATSAAGSVPGASAVSDAWKSGTAGIHSPFARYHTNPYQVDPNLFHDPNADANKARYQAAIAAAQGRTAPTAQAAQVDPTFRNNQISYIQALQQQAAGGGPSVAGAQLENAREGNIRSAMALGASSPVANQNPALAMRNIEDTTANLNQGAARDSATARMQEQLNAQGLLGNALSGARGQDIQTAGYQQQANMANLQSNLTTRSQIDELVKFYQQAGLSVDEAQFAAQQHLGELQQQAAMGAQGLNAQSAWNANQMVGNLLGGLTSAGGSIGASAAMPGAAAPAVPAGVATGLAVASGGTVVPGADHGVDEKPYMLRPGEIVVNPERRMAYYAALTAPDSPARLPVSTTPARSSVGYIEALRQRLMAPPSGRIYTTRTAENAGTGG